MNNGKFRAALFDLEYTNSWISFFLLLVRKKDNLTIFI